MYLYWKIVWRIILQPDIGVPYCILFYSIHPSDLIKKLPHVTQYSHYWFQLTEVDTYASVQKHKWKNTPSWFHQNMDITLIFYESKSTICLIKTCKCAVLTYSFLLRLDYSFNNTSLVLSSINVKSNAFGK